MAKTPPKQKAGSNTRTLIKLVYALPVLFILGLLGFAAYNRVTHQPPPVHQVATSPFAIVPIGGLTASIFTEGPSLRAGPHEEDVIIEFRDRGGQLTNVGAVSFSLMLKATDMVMDSIGKVFNTATPGQYRTSISLGVSGDWTLKLSYTNSVTGTIEASAPVKVI